MVIDKLADRECQAYASMEAFASNEMRNWEDIAEYVAPRKSAIVSTKTQDIEEYSQYVHDTEAVHSNNVLASGQMDYMVSGRWFSAEPPDKEAPQEARDWYSKCAEITMEILQETNFDLMIHEFFQDRGGFGTAMIHVEEDEEDYMFFAVGMVGTFFVRENRKGLVDTLRRKIKMTCDQAVEEFGEENISPPMKECYYSDDSSKKDQLFEVIHTIRPRKASEREYGKIDGENKPWASIYTCRSSKTILRNGGYDEQPFTVSRFHKWGDSPYGWCPGHMVIGAIRQLQNIERDMDAVSEVMAFPRILTPKGSVNTVRMEASGVTVWDPGVSAGQEPREWATASDPRFGIERAEIKREQIRREYLVDLFQMLTNADESRREKTAYEVAQMLHEKLTRISPTFARIKMEVFKPLLRRIFSILFRANVFPDAPPSVGLETAMGKVMPLPKFVFTSKLAMAIKSMENMTFLEWWNMISPIADILGPEEFAKNLNFTRLIRLTGDNHGVAVDFFNSPEERAEIEEQMALQQQMEQSTALAESGSKIASNLKNMPPQLLREMEAQSGAGELASTMG